MKMKKNFRLSYDKEGDILYINTKGSLTNQDISQELGEDVVVWRNKKTQEVSGFTVLNFSQIASRKSSGVNLPFEAKLYPTL